MSLRERVEQEARREHQQRLAMVGIGTLLVLALAVFCFVGVQIVTPEQREIDAGLVTEYVDNVPRRFEVEQLSVSLWAERRQDVSDDIIFVMREQDGTWRALLGLDMRTGCFLHWEEATQLFESPSSPECLNARYTPDGRFLDGLPIGDSPKPMAELKLEIRDDQVVVIDSLVLPESKK